MKRWQKLLCSTIIQKVIFDQNLFGLFLLSKEPLRWQTNAAADMIDLPGLCKIFSPKFKFTSAEWRRCAKCFFQVSHHPGVSFINWAHVPSLTCKANVQSTKTSLSWIDIVDTNHKKRGKFPTEIPQWNFLHGTKFWICYLLIQIFLDLQPYLPCSICPFSWLHLVGSIRVACSLGTASQQLPAICPEHSQDFPRALKEFATHLLGLHAPATVPGFGFCQ